MHLSVPLQLKDFGSLGSSETKGERSRDTVPLSLVAMTAWSFSLWCRDDQERCSGGLSITACRRFFTLFGQRHMQARSCLLAFFMESLIALCCEHSENCERATENACSDWDTDLCSLEKSPWLPRLVGPLRGQSQTCSSTSSLVQSKSSKTGLFYWHCGAKRRECGGLHLPQLREIGQGPQPFHYFQGGPWSLELGSRR
jgi:hypothetical protein